jgi:hypothetical protein
MTLNVGFMERLRLNFRLFVLRLTVEADAYLDALRKNVLPANFGVVRRKLILDVIELRCVIKDPIPMLASDFLSHFTSMVSDSYLQLK